MIILGIETSCDETAAGIVEITKNGNLRLLSNVVLSSMDLHKAYGGVVPEIAARSHIESIVPVIEQALAEAFGKSGSGERGISKEEQAKKQPLHTSHSSLHTPHRGSDALLWDQIDGIAVTYGAGLGGSLLIGVMTARTLAIVKDKPLYAINHVEGHIYANFITLQAASPRSWEKGVGREEKFNQHGFALPTSHYSLPEAQPEFPMLGLIVSGGHSQLVLWRGHFDYTLLGQTQDDAIGEAFDKVAKILGLPYPGGPSIGKKALEGDPNKYQLPKAKMPGKYDFSFSGLKTAALRLAQAQIGEDYTFPSTKLPERLSDRQKADIAASFQRIAIETVVDKTLQAYKEFSPKSVVIGGGVASSLELRRQLSRRLPININYSDPRLMTDNGAMIAALGCFKSKLNQPAADPYSLEIEPNLSM